jgi:hypothetical protein
LRRSANPATHAAAMPGWVSSLPAISERTEVQARPTQNAMTSQEMNIVASVETR